MKKYSIIIKTSEYAGNFEREMCAYITGEESEFDTGDYQNEEGLNYDMFKGEIIEKRSDEYGDGRPVTITGNNVEIFFNDKPTIEILELFKTRAKAFKYGNMNVLDVYVEVSETITKRLEL